MFAAELELVIHRRAWRRAREHRRMLGDGKLRMRQTADGVSPTRRIQFIPTKPSIAGRRNVPNSCPATYAALCPPEKLSDCAPFKASDEAMAIKTSPKMIRMAAISW